jgi:SAM-dependent methyltransferase
MTGALDCAACPASFPIVRGIPRFVAEAYAAHVEGTVDGFGYQWIRANPLIQHKLFTAAETFLDFIHPVVPGFFAGKTVLDGGCGMGRFSILAHQFGARTVVGVDLSEGIEAAFENTRALEGVLVIQADLLALPLKRAFDYAFSIGVLHHTSAPRAAFDALVERVRLGGAVSAWVYGRENNDWIIDVLNPIREKLTSRLPRSALRALSYALTAPLYLGVKGVYRPLSRSRFSVQARRLFYFDYLTFLGQFGFHEQALIVFDHLVPEIAEYLSRPEFEAWFAENGLERVAISARNGNSWRGFGVQPVSENATMDGHVSA